MGKLTIDIPDGTHHHIKVLAANRGITIKDLLLDKILAEISATAKTEPGLSDLAVEWESRRKDFKLGRGDRSLRELVHDGHKW